MQTKTPLITLSLVTLLFISLPQLSMASAPRLENLNDTMCHDAKSDLMWQFGKSKTLTSPKEAVEYAENLEPNDQCGGGYDFIVKKKGYVRAVRP